MISRGSLTVSIISSRDLALTRYATWTNSRLATKWAATFHLCCNWADTAAHLIGAISSTRLFLLWRIAIMGTIQTVGVHTMNHLFSPMFFTLLETKDMLVTYLRESYWFPQSVVSALVFREVRIIFSPFPFTCSDAIIVKNHAAEMNIHEASRLLGWILQERCLPICKYLLWL